MTKTSPYLWGDEGIYDLDGCEIEFLLNSRKLFDFGFGIRFDEIIVKKMGFSVGLLLHTANVVQFDDSVTERFFEVAKRRGVDFFYAIPTGYRHDKCNLESMEVALYDPPLLGKIPAEFEWFSKVRGGQIGIYSRSHYLFSGCLNFSLLDVDGEYTLIMGDDNFVREVTGDGSWRDLDKSDNISEHIGEKLKGARLAYGYV
ncbi:hypothetical protein PQQ75_35565 [Paraburkholderia aspalathi]|jgi:hypothetical protein|uniref:hypothetical protein n=1 Tax=Paraburkholderia aspalathi TaxID=1324617 RepID=UPI0038B9E49D